VARNLAASAPTFVFNVVKDRDYRMPTLSESRKSSAARVKASASEKQAEPPAIVSNSPSRLHAGSLLSVADLSIDDVRSILKLADELEAEPAAQRATRLFKRRVSLLFYESSTRTRTSFELAAKALGADTSLVSAQSSSIEKGESLKDTGITLRARRICWPRRPACRC
jgi:aspartate carbamoyltransferase catalytic subunit